MKTKLCMANSSAPPPTSASVAPELIDCIRFQECRDGMLLFSGAGVRQEWCDPMRARH